jgi:hypothetical protein
MNVVRTRKGPRLFFLGIAAHSYVAHPPHPAKSVCGLETDGPATISGLGFRIILKTAVGDNMTRKTNRSIMA